MQYIKSFIGFIFLCQEDKELIQVILLEGKKIFIHQKVFLWLVLFFCLKFFSVIYIVKNTEPDLPEEYPAYFQVLGGKVTEAKKQYINKKYQSLSAIPKKINDLEDKYQNREIASEEYLDKLSRYSRIKQEQDCIKLFYNKYQYASADKEKRYIVQDVIWDELLAKEHMDWWLVVFLFIIAVPVFCDEYQSEMQNIQVCSVQRGKVAAAKIMLVAGLALLIVFLFSTMEYYLYTIYMGGIYPNAPIQSLEFFEDSTMSVSFFGLWVIQTACKMSGALFLVFIIMAVSIMLKKSLLTLITSLLTIIIPVNISDVPKIKYLFPCPAGLLYAVGYFYPDLYDYQLSDETGFVEKVVLFPAFERGELVGIFIVFLALMVFLAFFITFRYENKSLLKIFIICSNRKVLTGKNKLLLFFIKIIVFMILLFSTLELSGCNTKESHIEENFYENSCNTNGQINKKYYFVVEENNVLIYNLKTQEETYLFKDVFLRLDDTEEYNLSLYTTEDYLYYGKDYDGKLLIFKTDLSDFSSVCIYQKKYGSIDVSYDLMLVSANAFFVNDSINQKCYCINREDGQWQKINTAGGLYAADFGNVVYYENMESHIASYNVITGRETVYTDISLRSQFSIKNSAFYIYGDFCFYTNMLDNDNIYCYQFSIKKNELFLKDKKNISFWCDESFFYYIESDGKLIEIDIETKEKRTVQELEENETKRSMDGRHFYQADIEGNYEIIK